MEEAEQFRWYLRKEQSSHGRGWFGNIDNVGFRETDVATTIDVGSLAAGVWRAHQCHCCHFFAGDRSALAAAKPHSGTLLGQKAKGTGTSCRPNASTGRPLANISQTSFASFLAGGQIIADRDDAVPKALNPHFTAAKNSGWREQSAMF